MVDWRNSRRTARPRRSPGTRCTPARYTDLFRDVIMPDEKRVRHRGRPACFMDGTLTAVDPNDVDGGTAFRRIVVRVLPRTKRPER
jgi:hypothetical protein